MTTSSFDPTGVPPGDFGRGYHPPLEPAPELPSLAALRSATFTQRHSGGYDQHEVDAFLDALVDALETVQNERDSLREQQQRGRQELAVLADQHGQLQQEDREIRSELERLRDAAEQRVHHEIAVDAVGLLSKAQVIADRCVEDAEQYARDLVLTARQQYRDVLERAEHTADETVRTLPGPPVGVTLRELEYVRTYAQVARIQLRSVLDALSEQLEQLGDLPPVPEVGESEFASSTRPDHRAHPPTAVASAPVVDLDEVSWDPAPPQDADAVPAASFRAYR